MKVFCLIGDERTEYSRSPAMFSAVLKRSGIQGAYVPFAVKPPHIGQALQSLRVLNIAGANVAVPYKETAVPHMDVLSEGANIIGAVNTIVRRGDELKGYNTNAIGFMDTLNEVGFKAEGKSALVFGTGGAARSVTFILNWLRTDTIYVVGRNREQADVLVDRFGGRTLSMKSLAEHTPRVDIAVNTTSVSSPVEAPQLAALVDELRLPTCELVIDLNYGRKENFWQAMAQRQGIRFLDGLMTLAFQARRTFSLWTGMQIPKEEFLKALEG